MKPNDADRVFCRLLTGKKRRIPVGFPSNGESQNPAEKENDGAHQEPSDSLRCPELIIPFPELLQFQPLLLNTLFQPPKLIFKTRSR